MDLLKNRHIDSQKKSQLSLSQGRLKKGDVYDDADDDDEVRTSALQKRATASLSTEEFFSRIQYLSLPSHISREVWWEGGRGTEIDGQCNTYRWSHLGSQLPARPPYCNQGSFNLCNYFPTGVDQYSRLFLFWWFTYLDYIWWSNIIIIFPERWSFMILTT